MPSLFTNDQSRGPLYQYWKERGGEEKSLRDQRVEEAKARSRGFKPISPTYGPSSNDSYKSRAMSGPPAYANEATGLEGGVPSDELPMYVDTTTDEQRTHSTSAGEAGLFSADAEKSRLRALEEQHRQTQSDAAIAQTLSNDEARAQAREEDAEGKGKQPERRKSTIGKVGSWLADAATGYTKKQERW